MLTLKKTETLAPRIAISLLLIAAATSVSMLFCAPEVQAQAQQAAINAHALAEFFNRSRALFEQGQINLSAPVELMAGADIDTHGALTNITVFQNAGDVRWQRLAQDFLNSLSSSGTLSRLSDIEHLNLKLKIDGKEIQASASSQMKTGSIAAQTARNYDFLFHAAAITNSGRATEEIYKNLQVSAHEREVRVDFSMPRETFNALLSRYLSTY